MTYVTTSKAGEMLSRTDRAVRALCESGRFPGAFRPFVGGHWRIPLADVEAMIEAGKARVIRRAKAA